MFAHPIWDLSEIKRKRECRKVQSSHYDLYPLVYGDGGGGQVAGCERQNRHAGISGKRKWESRRCLRRMQILGIKYFWKNGDPFWIFRFYFFVAEYRKLLSPEGPTPAIKKIDKKMSSDTRKKTFYFILFFQNSLDIPWEKFSWCTPGKWEKRLSGKLFSWSPSGGHHHYLLNLPKLCVKFIYLHFTMEIENRRLFVRGRSSIDQTSLCFAAIFSIAIVVESIKSYKTCIFNIRNRLFLVFKKLFTAHRHLKLVLFFLLLLLLWYNSMNCKHSWRLEGSCLSLVCFASTLALILKKCKPILASAKKTLELFEHKYKTS